MVKLTKKKKKTLLNSLYSIIPLHNTKGQMFIHRLWKGDMPADQTKSSDEVPQKTAVINSISPGLAKDSVHGDVLNTIK